MHSLTSKDWRAYVKVAPFLLLCQVLTLYRHWEAPGGENRGYWFFARVFAENGEFIIIERSPLYTLYLNLFFWMGFPTSVVVEFFVTSFIIALALLSLFKRYLSLGMAALAVVIVLPFIQIAEPSVQGGALACSCWAVVLRLEGQDNRFQKALSYALFGLAYLFRATYIIWILIFVGWDILRILRQKGGKKILHTLRPRLKDWPIAVVFLLLIWFQVMQSPHPWNNGWNATTTWYPSEGKSLRDASFIEVHNTKYIEQTYGTFEGHDFYFTNQELFNGANTMWNAIIANPHFFIAQVGRNLKDLLQEASHFVPLKGVFSFLPFYVVVFMMIFVTLYGAFRAAGKDEFAWLFVITSLLLIGTTTISIPKWRYMAPLLPVLVLSASWYGKQLGTRLVPAIFKTPNSLFLTGLIGIGILVLPRIYPMSVPKTVGLLTACIVLLFLAFITHFGSFSLAKQLVGLMKRVGVFLAIPLTLILFRPPHTLDSIAKEVFRGKELKILENRSNSWKAAYGDMKNLVQQCEGMMFTDNTDNLFVGAFMEVPIKKIYDLWEIPPFGHLDDTSYNGLRPDRIDCVVTRGVTSDGGAVNHKLRYQNYIQPYLERLRKMGAVTCNIPNFGQMIILPKSNQANKNVCL